MGKDENGASVGSAVLEFRGAGVPESARLTDNERLGVTTFKEAVAELGHSTLDLNPPQLHLEQWKTAFTDVPLRQSLTANLQLLTEQSGVCRQKGGSLSTMTSTP